MTTPVDLFCAGHTLLPDGRALVGGGTLAYGAWKGAKYLYAFNFATETYQRLTPLEVGRWYPSMITTISGQTLITGGLDHNGALTGTTELFDYRINTHQRLSGSHMFPLYPRIRLTKRLDYFFDGVGFGGYTGKAAPGFWEPTNGSRFTAVAGLRTPGQRSSGASCFVGDLRNQDLLVMGGGSPAVATTDRIKLSAASPRYTAGPTLKAAKMYLSCLTLPDGTLLEAGGGTANTIEAASYEVGLLKSIGSSWQSMNPIPAGNHRLYHSSLLLLDDGRVVSFGSNPQNQERSTTVLLYSPPYLYRGTRPTHHPDRLRIPISRRPHRPRHAQPRRSPTRTSRPDPRISQESPISVLNGDGEVRVDVHTTSGHLPAGARQRLADAVHEAVTDVEAERVSATVPMGDAELVDGIRDHLNDVELRAAGSTSIIEGTVAPT